MEVEVVIVKIGFALIIAIAAIGAIATVLGNLVGEMVQHPISLTILAVLGVLIFVGAIRVFF